MTIFGGHKAVPSQPNTGIWSLFFWKRVFETDVHVFAGGMLGVLTGKSFGVGGLAALPWTAALDAGALAVIISTLATLATQKIPNTPDGGFLPPAVPKK